MVRKATPRTVLRSGNMAACFFFLLCSTGVTSSAAATVQAPAAPRLRAQAPPALALPALQPLMLPSTTERLQPSQQGGIGYPGSYLMGRNGYGGPPNGRDKRRGVKQRPDSRWGLQQRPRRTQEASTENFPVPTTVFPPPEGNQHEGEGAGFLSFSTRDEEGVDAFGEMGMFALDAGPGAMASGSAASTSRPDLVFPDPKPKEKPLLAWLDSDNELQIGGSDEDDSPASPSSDFGDGRPRRPMSPSFNEGHPLQGMRAREEADLRSILFPRARPEKQEKEQQRREQVLAAADASSSNVGQFLRLKEQQAERLRSATPETREPTPVTGGGAPPEPDESEDEFSPY